MSTIVQEPELALASHQADPRPLVAMSLAKGLSTQNQVAETRAGIRVTETGIKIVEPMRIHRYHR